MIYCSDCCCVLPHADLEGAADLHHVVLFHHCDSEIVGLHEFLQENSMVLILTTCKWATQAG